MPPSDPASVFAGAEGIVLVRGLLRVEVVLQPFSLTVRRAGRRLLRCGGAWMAEGTIQDQFVQFTEGVLAREELQPAERALHAALVSRGEEGVALRISLGEGRRATIRISLGSRERIELWFEADREPLRLAFDWDRRSEERLIGLGLRHSTRFDQAGRDIQLGADRRYTGPDCPPEMLAEGGIPRATVPRCRGCCRAGGTPCGVRAWPTELASSSRGSGFRSPRVLTPGHCG